MQILFEWLIKYYSNLPDRQQNILHRWRKNIVQLNIRLATTDDLATLLKFEQLIIEYERPMCADMQESEFNYYSLQDMIESDNTQVVVAEDNGKIVAAGHAKIKKSRSYLTHEYHSFLGFMYVDQNYRGKGVNKLIIDALKTWSIEKGMTVCCLTVFDKNESALKAYQKIGFRNEIIEMRIAL